MPTFFGPMTTRCFVSLAGKGELLDQGSLRIVKGDHPLGTFWEFLHLRGREVKDHLAGLSKQAGGPEEKNAWEERTHGRKTQGSVKSS